MNVELIYDADCPNVAAARTALHDAFATASIPARWQEWVRGAPGSPIYTSAFGSPTILVDGEDVARGEVEGGDCCRIYVRQGVVGRAPDADLIASIQSDPAPRRRWPATQSIRRQRRVFQHPLSA